MPLTTGKSGGPQKLGWKLKRYFRQYGVSAYVGYNIQVTERLKAEQKVCSWRGEYDTSTGGPWVTLAGGLDSSGKFDLYGEFFATLNLPTIPLTGTSYGINSRKESSLQYDCNIKRPIWRLTGWDWGKRQIICGVKWEVHTRVSHPHNRPILVKLNSCLYSIWRIFLTAPNSIIFRIIAIPGMDLRAGVSNTRLTRWLEDTSSCLVIRNVKELQQGPINHCTTGFLLRLSTTRGTTHGRSFPLWITGWARDPIGNIVNRWVEDLTTQRSTQLLDIIRSQKRYSASDLSQSGYRTLSRRARAVIL